MAETGTERLAVGAGAHGREIAIARRAGAAPGLFWLGGFRSEMQGTKARAIDALGAAHGLAVTRFDYSGHGASGGSFAEGNISRWLEEARAVFATTTGEQVVIGSSMGAWLALLLNRALRPERDQEKHVPAKAGIGFSGSIARQQTELEQGVDATKRNLAPTGERRVKGLVLVAPAVDMTEELMLGKMSRAERRTLQRDGRVERKSAYSDLPDVITSTLIEDGRAHLLFGRGIETGCPVAILHGDADRDVPKGHALELLARLLSDPVTFTLIPGGDHRLSRPEDLRLLESAVLRAAGAAPG
jgi:pimeloyl-ACP methyl ester carboxylesterase